VIVTKFGGSSVADDGQIRKVRDIVVSDPRRRVVVVSAPGKRESTDRKITDLLFAHHAYAVGATGEDGARALSLIRERFLEIAVRLGVEQVCAGINDTCAAMAGSTDQEWIASRGEYLSALIIAAFLDAEFVDAADIIRFDAGGNFDPNVTYALTAERLAAAREQNRQVVVPGFYGSDNSGHIRCFPRGGSDITGSIVARSVSAEVYENWTDVSGMLVADPRVVTDPAPIPEMTYREQRELSYMGASVLHEEAVFPVREACIPIHIKNTNAPDAPGTRIVTARVSDERRITGIAGRRGYAVMSIEKAMMNRDITYGGKVLKVLEEHGVLYEHSPAAIDTFGLILTEDQMDGCGQSIIAEIDRVAKPDRIDVRHDVALIGVVGQGLARRVGVAASIFSALARGNVNIQLVNQWTSETNVIIGVTGGDFERAIQVLYDEFCADFQ
jgi:aspartate kinase